MSAQIKPFPLSDTPDLPPHNIEAEMGVLSAVLFDQSAFDRVCDKLSASSFYVSAHSKIYSAIEHLQRTGQPINWIQVVDWLQAKGQMESVGGKVFLKNLLEDPIASVNVDLYAEIVAEKNLRRQLIASSREVAALGYNQSVPISDVLDQSEQAIYQIANQSRTGETRAEHVSESCIRVYQSNEAGVSLGTKTGFLDLDELTGGIFPGQLITVAAATGMGKTHFGLAQAFNVASSGHPVVFFTCEMTADELTARLLARISGIDSDLISRSEVRSPEQFTRLLSATEKLSALPIYIFESSNPSPSDMRAQIRRVTAEMGRPPALVVLDYLQLLGDGGDNRVREIDLLTRACKGIAIDFKTTFLALAQVNRGVTNRQNKRPNLSDLRESGSIEQNSNRVIFLYREDYYDPDTSDRGTVELIVAKNRGGRTGAIKMLLNLELSYFKDIAKFGSDSIRVEQRAGSQTTDRFEEEDIDWN